MQRLHRKSSDQPMIRAHRFLKFLCCRATKPTTGSDIDHASMWVCRSCLVGAMIPVIRPSTEKWEFGTVERAFWQANHESKTINPKTGSDDPSKQHFLRFMDSKCEWAIVETTPYDHYIDFYKKRACAPVLLGHNLQISSFGDDGGEDMDGSDDDDDYEHESVPRRLEKSFETISDVDFTSIDQQPPMKMVTTPHRILAACSPVPYRYQILPSGNSVASSLSISTAFIERSGSLDHSPFATPTKISPRGREGDSTTTSPKYSQKLWTPEVGTQSCIVFECYLSPSHPMCGPIVGGSNLVGGRVYAKPSEFEMVHGCQGSPWPKR